MRAAALGGRFPKVVRRTFSFQDDRLAQAFWGHEFANPVGLAAGFDKNARHLRFWEALGFGFAEVGSVTARASAGNPKPRAFRLPDDRALVNRMGLNNDGARVVSARLAVAATRLFPVGVNLAKTHDPSILGDAALDDFATSFRALAPLADYVALNISCPNTAEGKTFEETEALDALLTRIMAERRIAAPGVPILVKLSPPSPSLDLGRVDELVAVARTHGVAGFIASNTAPDRYGLATDGETVAAMGRGGLSGRPLAARATALTRHLYRATEGELPVIGVGGIGSAESAYARLRAGASLVQLYSAMVYEGPGLVGRINEGLVRLMERDGFASVRDVIGADV